MHCGRVVVIDSIGGQSERAWHTDIAPVLKASHYKFPPSVPVEDDGNTDDNDEHIPGCDRGRDLPDTSEQRFI